ncbi:hypothetical protein METHB2_390033 [Candidatus Methylobacter favarea]|uniref:Uncharacterized protein n=1 Tax=Candidatus Methylobacter favarea TaxID=2707345 RepID=A0A8S0WB15_9GAMM|nr:hypothetical protein METHB2_390033 [Candidatus Methylobacter favarea]
MGIRNISSAELPGFRAEIFAFAVVLGGDLALIFWFGLRMLLCP